MSDVVRATRPLATIVHGLGFADESSAPHPLNILFKTSY